MAKLKSLRINKYRRVQPGTFIEFSYGINVLLGPNGAGKTALLDLVAALLGPTLEPIIGTEFDLECRFESNEAELDVHLVNRRSGSGARRSTLEEIGERGASRLHGFDFESKVSIRVGGSIAVISTDRDGIRCELDGIGHAAKLLFPPLSISDLILYATMSLPESPVQAKIEDIGLDLFNPEEHFRRLDEGLDTFRLLVRKAEIGTADGQVYSSAGNWLTDELIWRLRKEQLGPGIDLPLAEYPEFASAMGLMGFSSGSARFELEDSSRTPERTAVYRRLSLHFVRRDGSMVRHTHLSYGQKRLVAFFWHLFSCSSFAVVDELANGLHHSWIRACIEALGKRQSFLTSQNPLLLNALEFASREEVQNTFLLCGNEVRGGQERLVWKSLSEEEVDDFWEALQVGIQQVGDILEANGLW